MCTIFVFFFLLLALSASFFCYCIIIITVSFLPALSWARISSEERRKVVKWVRRYLVINKYAFTPKTKQQNEFEIVFCRSSLRLATIFFLNAVGASEEEADEKKIPSAD